MEATILSKVVLPIALFTVMFGMGLSLSVKDFRNVGRSPKSLLLGLSLQLLFLPLVGFGIAKLFNLSPLLAIGTMVIALCPGGVTSNMFSYLARGNVALSVSLTAVVSLITPFTIPVLLAASMSYFGTESSSISLPIQKTIMTLIAITVLPIGLGMVVKIKFGNFAQRSESIVKILSMVFLAIVIIGITKQVWDDLGDFFAKAGFSSLTLCGSTMILGFFISKGLKLPERDAVTNGIEVGIQNGTTGLFITSTLLNNPVMSIPPAVYSLLMFAIGGFYAAYFSRKLKDGVDANIDEQELAQSDYDSAG